MIATTLNRGAARRVRLLRLSASFACALALTTAGVILQASTSSAIARHSSPLTSARARPHASGNVDFTGDWTVTDPGNGDTATLHVSAQKSDGSFSGTVDPPGDAPA